MKKLLTIAALIIFNLNLFSQINEIDLSTAIPADKWDLSNHEVLVKLDENCYFISYAHTMIGYKHSFVKAYKIFKDNNLDLLYPTVVDIETYPSYVDNLIDYESMHIALLAGSAEINKTSDTENGWRMSWLCDDKNIVIFLIKL